MITFWVRWHVLIQALQVHRNNAQTYHKDSYSVDSTSVATLFMWSQVMIQPKVDQVCDDLTLLGVPDLVSFLTPNSSFIDNFPLLSAWNLDIKTALSLQNLFLEQRFIDHCSWLHNCFADSPNQAFKSAKKMDASTRSWEPCFPVSLWSQILCHDVDWAEHVALQVCDNWNRALKCCISYIFQSTLQLWKNVSHTDRLTSVFKLSIIVYNLLSLWTDFNFFGEATRLRCSHLHSWKGQSRKTDSDDVVPQNVLCRKLSLCLTTAKLKKPLKKRTT